MMPPRALSMFIGVGAALGVAACDDAVVPTPTADAPIVPAVGRSASSDTVWVPAATFIGRVENGRLVVETVPAERRPRTGLRTTRQAAWCEAWTVYDGIVGAGPRNSVEAVVESIVGTTPLADGGCGEPTDDPTMLALGTSCGRVTVRSFYEVPLHDVVAVMTEVAPGGRTPMAWPLDGAEPIEGSGLPSQQLGAWSYGEFRAVDRTGSAAAATRTWRLRNLDRGPFVFQGQIYVVFDERCNGIDDDCDGEIDEGLPSCR